MDQIPGWAIGAGVFYIAYIVWAFGKGLDNLQRSLDRIEEMLRERQR